MTIAGTKKTLVGQQRRVKIGSAPWPINGIALGITRNAGRTRLPNSVVSQRESLNELGYRRTDADQLHSHRGILGGTGYVAVLSALRHTIR